MKILRFFRRPPDFVIGGDYLRRWWVIPRNRFFNIYLHNICRSDDDRALHDHPWWNVSILLSGSYVEHTPAGEVVRRRGAIVWRPAEAAHRLELRDGPVWTLFITGPRRRHWGFWCGDRWVHWQDFTESTDKSQIGRGCAE